MESVRTREVVIGLAGVAVAVGGTAMIESAQKLWPDHPGIIFLAGAALVLLGLSAFVWAIVTAQREARMTDDKKENEEKPYTGPTTGVHMENCHDNTFGSIVTEGFDTGMSMSNSRGNRFLRVTSLGRARGGWRVPFAAPTKKKADDEQG